MTNEQKNTGRCSEGICDKVTQNECHPQKHNKGVTCDVKNCTYHDGECWCCAEQISVGPSFASSCTDTVCATFKSK